MTSLFELLANPDQIFVRGQLVTLRAPESADHQGRSGIRVYVHAMFQADLASSPAPGYLIVPDSVEFFLRLVAFLY